MKYGSVWKKKGFCTSLIGGIGEYGLKLIWYYDRTRIDVTKLYYKQLYESLKRLIVNQDKNREKNIFICIELFWIMYNGPFILDGLAKK